MTSLKNLSIPLWCDWDAAIRNELPPEDEAFNPTVVRLGPPAGRRAARPAGGFQSHCGAIGTTAHAGRQTPLCRLSIPLWCDWDQ